MGKFGEILTGIKVLEEADSPINGKISVIKSLAFGTYIQVSGLTQSGGIIKSIWNKTLKKVASSKKQVARVLILGLGGGSIVEVVKKYWPRAEITAVDIDPIMVELGKKYLGLDEYNINIIIGDAYNYLNQISKSKNQNDKSKFKNNYDLILVDLYIGDEFPKKFESDEFLRSARRNLVGSGIVIFNRLYYGDKRSQAMRFENKLEKMFKNVEYFYPEANLMFICST